MKAVAKNRASEFLQPWEFRSILGEYLGRIKLFANLLAFKNSSRLFINLSLYSFLCWQIEKSIEYEIGGQNISRELEDVVELRSRVFLLYAEEGEAEVVFQQAALFGLTGVGHVWIVSQQALMAKSCPVGQSILNVQKSYA